MPKESITIRLESELIEGLEEESDEEGVSRSEYIRQILRERDVREELRDEIDTLRGRIESREERIETLESQLARRSQLEEKVDEVALEVRQEREESNAPFLVRWWRWYKE